MINMELGSKARLTKVRVSITRLCCVKHWEENLEPSMDGIGAQVLAGGANEG